MNCNEQIIAIAEACNCDYVIWRNTNEVEAIEAPDYINDLNAMREAVRTLDNDQALAYIRSLVEDVLHLHFDYSVFKVSLAIAQATAAQHAEAFLRALGKWTT